jgi:hypothetical protein
MQQDAGTTRESAYDENRRGQRERFESGEDPDDIDVRATPIPVGLAYLSASELVSVSAGRDCAGEEKSVRNVAHGVLS